MKLSLCLIIIILLVLIVCYKYSCYSSNTNSENNKVILEHFQFDPLNPPNVPNTAYIAVIADDTLEIYHSEVSDATVGTQNISKLVGKAFCCGKLYTFKVSNFKPSHRLLFYNLNSGGPGYFAGHVVYNGITYPTNSNNFKILSVKTEAKNVKHASINNGYVKAGQRIGCFRDSSNRRLPFEGGGPMSHEECRDIALTRQHAYYSLQNGGFCYTGTDYSLASSLGNLPDTACNMPGKKDSISQTSQRLGGVWANDIHTTLYAPRIRECGRAGYPFLHNDAMILKSEQGPNCENNDLNWVEYEWMPLQADSIRYCPNPEYVEFQSNACTDPTSNETCQLSPKTDYVPDDNLCIHTIQSMQRSQHYGNDYVLSILIRAFRQNPNNVQISFALEEVIRLCCKILSKQDERYSSIVCTMLEKDTGYPEKKCNHAEEKYKMLNNIGSLSAWDHYNSTGKKDKLKWQSCSKIKLDYRYLKMISDTDKIAMRDDRKTDIDCVEFHEAMTRLLQKATLSLSSSQKSCTCIRNPEGATQCKPC